MNFEEYAASMSWRTVAERTKAKAVWQYQQASIDGLLEDQAKDRARIDELDDELHCVRAYNDSLLKRIDLLEQRVRDLQGHDDLGYIDYKLAEAAHEAIKQWSSNGQAK